MVSNPETVRPAYQLHPYQRQVLHDLLEVLVPPNPPRFGKGPRAIAHLPTGAGKTRLACHAACHLLNLRGNEDKILVWLASSEELCEQAAENLTAAWYYLGNRPLHIQRYWGSANEPTREHGFLVTSLAKLYSASNNNDTLLIELATRAAAVVFDEAHQAVATTYQFITRQLLTYEPPLLGLTATPGRQAIPGEEDYRLAELFNFRKVTIDPQGHSDPVTYLITQGYLADPQFTPITLTSDLPVTAQTDQDDYQEPTLRRIGEDPNWQREITRVTAQALHDHRRVIVFCPSLESVRQCGATLAELGFRVGTVTGSTPSDQRHDTIEQFKSDQPEPMAILNYNVLTAGFDAPRTSCVVVARPTMSLVLYSQMVGRAMRGHRSGGNLRCQIYSIIDTQLPGSGSVAESFQNWEQLWQPT